VARVNLQEYCDEARELIAARAYDEAIAICRHILKRYPKHVRTYQILGEACLEKGEFQEAKDIFMRLLDHADPENFAAYAGLGVLAEREGKTDQAIWYMERAFELAPSSDEVRDVLRRLYGKRDGVEPTRIKLNKAALARLYARGGQYRQAIEEFRNLLALETHRDRVDLKVSLAETFWRDGRREQAAELSREVLQKSTNCLKALLLLGKIEMDKGRNEEGQAILEQARGLDPESLVAQALFGEQSPLLPQIVKIPRLEKPGVGVGGAEVSPVAPVVEEGITPLSAEQGMAPAAEVGNETVSAVVAEPPAAVAEATVHVVPEVTPVLEEEPKAEAVVAEVAGPTAAVEEAAAPVVPEVTPVPEETPKAEAVVAEIAAPLVAVEETVAPVVPEVTPVPEEEPKAEAVVAEIAEPVVAVEEVAAPVVPEVTPVPEEEPKVELVVAEVVEPVVVAEEAAAPVMPAPEEQPQPEATVAEPVAAVEETVAGLPEGAPEVVQAVVTPALEQAAPVAAVAKDTCADETVLVPGTAIGSAPLSDVECCKQHLERHPKDDAVRLALARAYQKQEQVRLALEQYGLLLHAKSEILPEVIGDMEMLVASRPDYMEAHELLADLYMRTGRLQEAVDRYRWILKRVGQTSV